MATAQWGDTTGDSSHVDIRYHHETAPDVNLHFEDHFLYYKKAKLDTFPEQISKNGIKPRSRYILRNKMLNKSGYE